MNTKLIKHKVLPLSWFFSKNKPMRIVYNAKC